MFLKRTFLSFIIIILFVLSLFSCPNSDLHNIKFMAYNDENGCYEQIETLPVISGSMFSSTELLRPYVLGAIDKEDYYRFDHWSTEEGEVNTLNTTGEQYNEDTPIENDVTLYAVYTPATDLFSVVTFKLFDESNPGYNIEIKKGIPNNTELQDIDITLDDIVVDGVKYSFDGWADESQFLDSFDFSTLLIDNDVVLPSTTIQSNNTYYANYKGDYLAFTAKEDTHIYFDIVGTLDNPISLKYKKNKETEFKPYTFSGNQEATSGSGYKLSLYVGETVYFYGTNASFSKDKNNYVVFRSTKGKVKASGCVMTLLDCRDKVVSSHCFNNLFKDCTYLLTAPTLPAVDLSPSCYYGMFSGCTSLTVAPELPATKIAEECYYQMFYNCTSLTQVPSLLPAEGLAAYCYKQMFYDCESITDAPKMYAWRVAEGSCAEMFKNCTSLKKAPYLLINFLAPYCCAEMFMNCTSLTRVDNLPASELPKYCYYKMFYGCSNLSFVDCSLIRRFNENNDATTDWLYGVSSKGHFRYCSNSTLFFRDRGPSTIPVGWTTQYK